MEINQNEWIHSIVNEKMNYSTGNMECYLVGKRNELSSYSNMDES